MSGEHSRPKRPRISFQYIVCKFRQTVMSRTGGPSSPLRSLPISPKFIFILRNPIDRYISHFNWLKGLGQEKRKINEVIGKEKYLDFKEYDGYPKQYYQFGLYNKWISRFIENFGEESIKIVTFEKLVSERLNILNSCYEFLGVSKMQSVKFIKSNKTNKVIFPSLYHFLRKSSIGKMKYTCQSTYGVSN